MCFAAILNTTKSGFNHFKITTIKYKPHFNVSSSNARQFTRKKQVRKVPANINPAAQKKKKKTFISLCQLTHKRSQCRKFHINENIENNKKPIKAKLKEQTENEPRVCLPRISPGGPTPESKEY